MFNLKSVQFRILCSNSKIVSNSNLFKFEFVQIWIFFKLDFVHIQICSNSILFRFKFKTVQNLNFCKKKFNFENLFKFEKNRKLKNWRKPAHRYKKKLKPVKNPTEMFLKVPKTGKNQKPETVIGPTQKIERVCVKLKSITTGGD
jgi:hypothetical protein